MGTATSRVTTAAALATLAIAGSAGCAATQRTPQSSRASASGFAAVERTAAPSGWRSLSTASGATLFYPPGWMPARGDAGTATAVLQDPRRGLLGYLNLTPRQGEETLAGWARFRLEHNARDGDRGVTEEEAARGVRFRNGIGTCVRDRYTTSTGARYVELACLVKGAAATSVIVAASPPQAWARVSPSLYRALSALRT